MSSALDLAFALAGQLLLPGGLDLGLPLLGLATGGQLADPLRERVPVYGSEGAAEPCGEVLGVFPHVPCVRRRGVHLRPCLPRLYAGPRLQDVSQPRSKAAVVAWAFRPRSPTGQRQITLLGRAGPLGKRAGAQRGEAIVQPSAYLADQLERDRADLGGTGLGLMPGRDPPDLDAAFLHLPGPGGELRQGRTVQLHRPHRLAQLGRLVAPLPAPTPASSSAFARCASSVR